MSPVVIVIVVVVVLSRVVVVVVWEVTFPLGYMQQTYQNYGTLCLAAATKILKNRAQQHLGVLGSSPFAANHSAHTLMGRDAAILEASGAVLVNLVGLFARRKPSGRGRGRNTKINKKHRKNKENR